MEKISLSKRYFFMKIIPGITWMVIGILWIIGTKLALKVALVLDVVCVASISYSLRHKADSDEMSDKAMMNAESFCFMILMITLMIVSCVAYWFGIDHQSLPINYVTGGINIILGVMNIFNGLMFAKFDKEGD